jgi:predicted DNA-binding transcriptional regulator AlpA
MQEPRNLTTKQAAQRLGMCAKTLRRWRTKRGGPPYLRYGPKNTVYPEAKLEEWLAKRLVVAAEDTE